MGALIPDDLPKNSSALRGMQVSSPVPPPAPIPTSASADPRFLDALVLEYIDGHNWKVVNEFDYKTDIGRLGIVPVPAGFVTDFASIPKVFWNVMPPTGSYGKAAVIHDALYRTPTLLATRAEADTVFLEAMTALGVGWWTRNIMYRGVRIFGAPNYASRRQEKPGV